MSTAETIQDIRSIPMLFCRAAKLVYKEQEAQLPQRDRATRYVSKFVLFHELWLL